MSSYAEQHNSKHCQHETVSVIWHRSSRLEGDTPELARFCISVCLLSMSASLTSLTVFSDIRAIEALLGNSVALDTKDYLSG